MFSQKIEFENYKKELKNDLKESIEYFICCLINNGQILSEYLLTQNNSGYTLYATTPKVNSLDSCFDSVYGKTGREKLAALCSISVTPIGINIYSQEYCSCKNRSSIEMQTFANDIDSVFTCCGCGKPIALYELPYIDKQDDHWYIVNWQKTYSAVHTLWLDSLNDRFTGNQLVNANSALNKIGRKIADEISLKTGVKCYYNIFDDLSKRVKLTDTNGKIVRICPSCEKAMHYEKFGEDYERYICEECKISSDLPK